LTFRKNSANNNVPHRIFKKKRYKKYFLYFYKG
jgi:hypothetical protein